MSALRPEIAELFPDFVRGAELSLPEQARALYPEEEASIQRAVTKRRTEFSLGRTAAREALAGLGIASRALPAKPDRSVAWPSEAWGSITHAEGLCVAIAARRAQALGLGIDAELKGRVEPRLWRMIATARETEWLSEPAPEAERLLRAALLFSAKESFYKAQFCVSRSWVGFQDVEVEFDERTFSLRLLKGVEGYFAQGTRFSGRHVVLAEHVVTGLVILPR